MTNTLRLSLGALALLACVLVACFSGSPEAEAQSGYTGYTESCEASYYGGSLIGNYTASGEIFTGEAGTAAHPWLPFGTVVLVESPYGSDYLRITDRGPYIAGRCLDVSEGSNYLVGGYVYGVAPVTITVVN